MVRAVLVSGAAFGAGYLAATWFVFPAPSAPSNLLGVPNLRGLDLSRAEDRISAGELRLGAIDSLYHPSVPEGFVIGQSPLPGQLALPAATVELAVSLGPERRIVPDLVGQDERRARIVLAAAGFSVVVDHSVRPGEVAGQVMASKPSPGTGLQLPAEVRLQVSLGPPSVEMPMLGGLAEEEARALLDSFGLFVNEIREVDRQGARPGIVIEQDPPPGIMVEVGADVMLVVGRIRRPGIRPSGQPWARRHEAG